MRSCAIRRVFHDLARHAGLPVILTTGKASSCAQSQDPRSPTRFAGVDPATSLRCAQDDRRVCVRGWRRQFSPAASRSTCTPHPPPSSCAQSQDPRTPTRFAGVDPATSLRCAQDDRRVCVRGWRRQFSPAASRSTCTPHPPPSSCAQSQDPRTPTRFAGVDPATPLRCAQDDRRVCVRGWRRQFGPAASRSTCTPHPPPSSCAQSQDPRTPTRFAGVDPATSRRMTRGGGVTSARQRPAAPAPCPCAPT